MSRRIHLPEHWTPIQEAAYLTVHSYPGGATRLAPLVGKTPRSLDNEVNPDVPTAKLGIEDAVTLQHGANDYRLLEAMAMTLGFAVLRICDHTGISDVELLDAYSEWNAEIGETHSVIRKALSDGRVTRSEVDEIRREMFEDFQRELGVLARLEALVEDEEDA